MKLESLEIDNFGVFSGNRLQFASGFQVIYGPNEAGKSTLLQLIRELLFGFPHRSPYSFDVGRLEAEATIRLRDTQRITFRRRKGRGRTVTGVIEGSGTEVDDTLLERMLGNASGKLYENVFGFSLRELASGEESLKHANLSEALYGGGIGGLSGFQNLREEIQNEHEKLFNPKGRGSNQEINGILNELKEKRKSLKQMIVAPREYKAAEKAEKQASEAVEQLRLKREQLQRQAAHHQRLLKALEPFLKLRRLRQELQDFSSTVRISEQASGQHRTQLQRLNELADEVSQLQTDHEQAVRDVKSLTLQPELLKAEPSIKRLQQDVGRIRNCLTEIPRMQQEVRQLQQEIVDELKRLQPDWSLEELERFQITQASEAAFAELSDELQDANECRNANRARLAEAQKNLERLKIELAQLEETPLDPALSALVDQERTVLKQRDEMTAALQQLETLEKQVQHRFARLNPRPQSVENLSDSLDMIASLSIPAEATIQEFRQQFSECDQEIERARQKWNRDADELHEHEQERDALTQQSDVPSREELERQRRLRDRDWQWIRHVLIEGGEAGRDDDIQQDGQITDRQDRDDIQKEDADSIEAIDREQWPDQFEERVRNADQVADERQSHAEIVARLDALEMAVRRSGNRVELSELKLREAEDRRARLQQDWESAWSDSTVTPLRPDVMLEWRAAFCQIVSDHEECSQLGRKVEADQRSLQKFTESLSEALGDDAPAVTQSVPTDRQLDGLLKVAQQRVHQARDTERDRDRLQRELPEQTSQFEQLTAESALLVDRLQRLDDRRVQLLGELGFQADWSVTVAGRILSGLKSAQLKLDQSRRLERQIDEMKAECERFEVSQKELCQRVANEPTDMSPPDAIAQLNELLLNARQIQQSHESVTRDVQRLAGELASRETRRREVEEQLRQSREAAGVDSDQEFFEVAAASMKHQQIETEITQHERSIELLREAEDAESFFAELENADPDEVAMTCQRLGEEQRALDETYEAALEERKSARDRLNEFNRSSSASAGQQAIESELARLSDAVDRWAPLVLARALMSRAIREFEKKHQPALFDEVSRLFSRMTDARYVGLSQKLDEDRTLQLEQPDGTRKSPDQLSTGTREQLYLAIRLAYVQHYCRDSEPLPLIMDDILVNFDEQRARNTLEVLLDLPDEIQVLFLTCHEHMAELVRELRPTTQPIELSVNQVTA